MAYTKQTWADLPSKTTPINAERLTHIEDGIFNAAQTADTAASTAGTAAANVGIVSGKVTTLEEQMLNVQNGKVDKVTGKGLSTNDYTNTDKAKVDALGTASTKNSTSVVTQSTDLVESGAVYDALGFGNKNLFDPSLISSGALTYVPIYVGSGDFTASTNMSLNTRGGANLFFFAGNVLEGGTTGNDGVWNGQTRTVTAIDGYVTIASRNADGVNPVDYNHQIEKGTVATAYEPYHESVEEYCASKKLLENTVGWISDEQAKLYNWTGSASDVTFTYTKEQLTLNGTCSSNTSQPSSADVPEDGKYTLKAGTYKLESDVNNVSWQAIGTNPVVLIGDSNKPFTITTDTTVFLRCTVISGSSFNNKIVHVSLRKLSVDETKADNSVIGTVEDGANPTKAYAVNEFMVRDGAFCQVTAPVTTSSTWTEGSNYTKKSIAEVLQSLMS